MRIDRRTALGLAPLIIAGCHRGGPNAVRVAIVGLQENFTLHLALELGHFRDAGVDVTIETVNGGSKEIEALMGGSADVVYDGYAYTLMRASEGRRLKAFTIISLRANNILAVSPVKAGRIRRVEELKGGVVGIGSFGGFHQRTLEHYLSMHGVLISDVRLATIGVGPAAVAALEHGKVDAGILNGSAYRLLKRRAPDTRVLVDPRTREECRRVFGVEAVPTVSLFATADWLDRHPNEARGMAQGMLKTMRWIREHSLEEVRARLPEGLRSPDAEADLETMRFVVEAFSPDGRMPPGGPEIVDRVFTSSFDRQKDAKFDLSQTFTDEFVDPVSRSGQ